MKKLLFIYGVVSTLLLGGLWYLVFDDHASVVTFYADKLRDSIFNTYLTLGGFLFSLKTFIVIHMKEKLYDDDRYKQRYDEMVRHKPSLTRYGPLKNLNNLLFSCVLGFVSVSIFNFAFGLISNFYVVMTCFWLSLFVMGLFVHCLFVIRSNLTDYFLFIEK